MWIRFIDWPATSPLVQPQVPAPLPRPIRHRGETFISAYSPGEAESTRLLRLLCEVRAIWPELLWGAFLVTTASSRSRRATPGPCAGSMPAARQRRGARTT